MASFFSNLFGGGAAAEAADKNRQLYGQYKTEGQQNLASGLNNSLSSLSTGYGNANSTLGQNKDVWSQYGANANGALSSGLNSSLGALGQGYGDAQAYLGQNKDIYGNLQSQGTTALDNGMQGSLGALSALQEKYAPATSTYLDSLGVNGAAGNANAVSSFQAGPGYQFQLDQGNDAINRRRASAGMLNSGNADIDALKFGQGLANQEYGNWQNRLQGFVAPETALAQSTSNLYQSDAANRLGLAGTVAGGLGATNTAMANNAGAYGNAVSGLYGTNAANQVGVAGNVATGQAGVNSGIAGNQAALGAGQAGLYTQNASDLTNLAGSVTSGNAQANTQQGQAETAGARNLLGVGMSLASLAAGGAGGGFGGLMGAGSTAGSALGSMGITYGSPGTAGSNLYGPRY